MFWETVAILCILAGTHYWLWKYTFNEGLVQGAEVTLDQLMKEKVIYVDDRGEIWQWDRYKEAYQQQDVQK